MKSPACSTSWRNFAGRSTKPFAIVMHPAHVEAIVARGKELARARGLVVFDSFERAAAAFRTASEYWANRARAGELGPGSLARSSGEG